MIFSRNNNNNDKLNYFGKLEIQSNMASLRSTIEQSILPEFHNPAGMQPKFLLTGMKIGHKMGSPV